MLYEKMIQKYENQLLEDRRYLHQHPEVGFELDNTVSYIKEKLSESGIVLEDIGDHGLTAVIGKSDGPCILIRADMDALPMKEESGLAFSSLNDQAAHTCGHDTHMAMLMCAARILKDMEDQLPGRIKLLFQPAEELGAGCKNMVEHGILENPKVDAAFGVHSMSSFPKGTVLYGTGCMCSGADLFTITIHGKGSHGSIPHTSIDPINIASHIVLNLQTLNSREIDAKESVVLNFGMIQAGSAANVIPETAVLMGNIRTFSNTLRKQVKKRLEEIVVQTAKMFSGSADIEYSYEMASVITDKEVMSACGNEVKKYVSPELVDDHTIELPFSEDFSAISDLVPSAFFLIGADPGNGAMIMQHNPKVIFDEESMKIGVLAYVAGAMGYLKEKEKK